MTKRICSMLLCLVMVLGMLPGAYVQAAGSNDVVYIDETTTMDQLVDSGIVHMENTSVESVDPMPSLTPQVPAPGTPVASQPVPITDVDGTQGSIPGVPCTCASSGALSGHSDGCALKQYYIGVCSGTPGRIYHAWSEAGESAQAFLLSWLEQNAPEKLEQVLNIIDDSAVSDGEDDVDRLSGEASVTLDGVTVDALGVPEGSTLTVQEPSAEVVAAVEEAVASEEEPEQLFLYDISVQNEESQDWQPEDTSVRMSLSIPGLKLHKYATVKVIHVDDDGNTSEMEGTLDEDGNIVFETEGFSTFAGFTVDFEYGAALVSIPGETSILLSELFEQMKMPLYASDVVDVQFTNYELLTVTQQEGDWLLTSLVPFDTHETLTMTMADGTVYQFQVTDAQYASIKTGANGTTYNDENGEARWFANSSGTLTEGNSPSKWQSAYWAEDKIVYITGPGTFIIRIQPDPDLSTSETDAYVRMKQVRVCGGADVTFCVGGQFRNPDSSDYGTKKWSKVTAVKILANESQDLFYIEDGSLTLKGTSDIQLMLSGDNKYTSDMQLVYMAPGADNFTAQYTTFYRAPYGAIVCRASHLVNFSMTNCDFRNTVYRTTYGGAIYIKQSTADVADGKQGQYTRVDNFTLKNVDFKGNYAGEKGGAIYLRGKIFNVSIDADCTFDGCHADAEDGGAIMIDGAMGNVQISAEFISCYAKENGGAIAIRSAEFTEVPRFSDETPSRIVHMFSRTNTLDLSGSRFTGCYTTITDSDTEGRGGAVDISAQVARVFMDGCSFDSCYSSNNKSSASGGAVCFSYANTPDNFKDTSKGGDSYWTAAMTLDGATEECGGERRSHTYDWTSTEKDADGNDVTTVKTRTTMGPVSITNTTFTNCTAGFHGGAVLFRSGSCVDSLTMTDVTIDNCSGAQQGGALMFVNTVVPVANLTRVTISNCKTLTPEEAGGTLRTVGQTTMVLTLDDCDFRYNQSADSGGGLYWNAGHVRTPAKGGDPVNPKAIVKNCRFICNSSYLLDQEVIGKGGGIFCEADMEVTDCLFVGNNAGQGGAICMAVYGNDYRMMQDKEVTRLKLNSGTEIYGNRARHGGGIMLRANATPSLKNDETLAHGVEFQLGGASVHDNAAGQNGGGVCFMALTYDDPADTAEVERYEKTIKIDNGTIYNNSAGDNGGGVYMESNNNTTIEVTEGTIYNNWAGLTRRFEITENTTDSGNTYTVNVVKNEESGGDGGGIYLTGKEALVTVSGGVIGAIKDASGNLTAAPNIAYDLITTSTDETTGETTTTRTGGNGGGIGVFGTSRIEMTGGTICYNQAHTAGGGIAVHGNSSMYLSSGTVDNNQATFGGGISINNSTGVAGATEETKKWGMYFDGGTISNNKAFYEDDVTSAYGGGVCLSANSTMRIDGGFITGNIAARDVNGEKYTEGKEGGGVAVCNGSSMTFYGGTIQDNHATNGGGIAIRGNSSVTMNPMTKTEDGEKVTTYGLVDQNTAQDCGGGIYLAATTGTGNTITINDGTVSDNTATKYSGGGVYVGEGNTFTIKDGKINDNEAVGDGTTEAWGGGIYCTGATANINGGEIYFNNARNGGGICLANSASAEITSGEIRENEAQENGGGIFATASAAVTVEQGSITANTAKANGGGICVAASDDAGAEVTVEGGVISGNEAGTAGGGIYASGVTDSHSKVLVSGGNITGNTGGNGGGLYADVSSEVEISDGSISDNSATGSGGGIFSYGEVNNGTTVNVTGGDITGNTAQCGDGGGIYSSDVSTIQISNGTISGNEAVYVASADVGGNGGGIYSTGASQVTLTGGDVLQNTAVNGGGIYATCTDKGGKVTVGGGQIGSNTATGNGGGIVATGKAEILVKGGTITLNTADGNGGGIYTTGTAPVVTVEKDKTNGTVGTITENTAANGGGIFVGAGGSLTVDEGYITYNTATVPAGKTGPATGKGQTDSLYGAGGGVCVVGDNGSTATFTLTGETDMAIYGNIAAHIADDVFSNGAGTQLDIPLVADMNLAGYGFSPEGWFEDYNTNDEKYGDGLNMGRNDLVKSVERYRFAVSSKRKHITPVYVLGTYEGANVTSQVYVNKANAYVAMTLGIPAAVDDTVVVDFGMTVEFDLMENDLIVSADDFTNTGKLGIQEPVAGSNGIKEKDDVVYGALLSDLFKTNQLVKKSTELKHGKAILSGSNVKYQFLSEADKLNMTSDETFYYVVGHGQNADGSYKNYYYAKVTIVPATSIYYEDNSGFVEFHEADEELKLVGWEPVGGSSVTDKNQDQDRPGAAELKDLDADNVYGFDSNYAETATYSMGNAMWTQVYGDMGARATFTFTGTGFDIISLSSKDTGTVIVTIYQGDNVIFEDDPTTAEEETPTKPYKSLFVDSWYETGNTLYQVPLIKHSGLPYDTWTVEVYAAYGWWADHGQNSGSGKCDFYLDAVRIYDPAGIGGSASGLVQDAYLKDNECWPSYQELRNLILTQDVLTDEAQSGILFVDGVGGMNKTPTITDYQNYGPNNEVYLADDQAVSFTLDAEAYNNGLASSGFNGSKVAAVHIAMRGLTGAGSVRIMAADGTYQDLTLSTTDLYYDITKMMGQQITIDNTGASPVSISTVKITHTADPGAAPATVSLFSSNRITAQRALAMLSIQEQTVPVLTPKYPSLTFEDEIRYDVFFDAQNLGQVTTSDLGLAVFTTEDPAATLDTASAVTWGAVEQDGLYMVRTDGIAAKNLGDTLYFKVVARLADGSYVYSDLRSYSAVEYANNTLAGEQNAAQKALVVAMLNYASAAQTYFNYRADALVNAGLTAEAQALVESYRADMMDGVSTPSADKAANFTKTATGFAKRYPTVTFEGAFSIDYFCQPSATVQGDITLYYWTQADYDAVSILSKDNATGALKLEKNGDLYGTSVEGIPAKDLDKGVYVAFVYTDGEAEYCSGILGYSIGAYCSSLASGNDAMAPFAAATAVYGYYAKQMFN